MDKPITLGINKEEARSFITSLTPHQLTIVSLISKGFLDKEIASILSVSYNTAKNSITVIYKKLSKASPTLVGQNYRILVMTYYLTAKKAGWVPEGEE